MHVLFIYAQPYPTEKNRSMGMYVHDQAIALVERGHQVGVLVPNYPHPSRVLKGKFNFQNAISKYILDGIPVVNFIFLPVPYIHTCVTKLLVSRSFDQYKEMYGTPDIIHAQFLWYGGIIANILGGLENIPYVITCHSSVYFKEKFNRYKYSTSLNVLGKAQRLIAVSEFLGNQVTNVFKFDNIAIIPNTIDNDKFSLHHSVKSKNNPFVFTSIGNLLINKNFDKLLYAFKYLNITNAILNIIGQGPQRAALEQLASDLEISEKVKFHGSLSRDELIKVLKTTNVVVSPSGLETFGMTIIEALCCGIPVLSTRSGGPEEIINKTNGILIKSNTPEQLQDGMRTIYKNYAQYHPQNIREDCIRRYGKEGYANRIEMIYESALNNSRSNNS